MKKGGEDMKKTKMAFLAFGLCALLAGGVLTGCGGDAADDNAKTETHKEGDGHDHKEGEKH